MRSCGRTVRTALGAVVLGGAFLTANRPVRGQDALPPAGPGKRVLGSHARPRAAAAPLYTGPQTFDMLHYRLDLSLAMVSEWLQGTATMTMVMKSPDSTVVLNEVQLSLDTLTVNGAPAAFTVDPASETFTIHLGGMHGAGDTLVVRIAYRRVPGLSRPLARLGYYYFNTDSLADLPANLGYTMSEPSDARFWMPCYDQPWEKATAEIHVTVPAGYVAASNGRWMGTTDNGDGTVTWNWREDHQIAPYLMCLTASRWSVFTVPFLRAPADTVPVQYYVWAQDSSVAAYLPAVRSMLAAYSSLFGPYPFDKYGMSGLVPFDYGGMEHQSMTTLNRYLEVNEKAVSHELAHQWWGDLVTCGTWKDIWLNESFATYSEALWKEYQGGFPYLKGYMLNSLLHFYDASWSYAVYDPESQGQYLFWDLVYSKGAWVLHTLRGVLGDSTFFQGLRAYGQKWAGLSAVTSDFQAVVDSVAGRDMSWFFDEWVYAPGWPEYAMNWTWSPDTLHLTVYQMQQQVQSASWPVYRMPLPIRIYAGTRDTTFTAADTALTQRFSFAFPEMPDSVAIDPDGWVLKQIVVPPASVAEGSVPSTFRLEQNYPNPFNPKTEIRYQVSGVSHVRLMVYDILGREVAVLVNELQRPGSYAVKFDGSSLASGVYICRLTAGSFVGSRRMVLIR